jgi:protein-disulfide isomerase
MTFRTLRRAALGAAFTGLVALVSAVSACAQPGGGGSQSAAASGASGAAAGGAAGADSVVPAADRSRSKGDSTAPVTIIEISDFQCPYCRQFAEETYRQLDSAYIQTGKVRLVFIHYPLPNHAQAFPAAEAAMCAGAQGKFWPMHDRIFASQREWSGQADAPQRFARMAVEVGLDAGQWRDCVENDRVAPIIINDVMGATQAGVNGTPTFILSGQKVLSGAVPFAEISREIDAILTQRQGAGPGQAPPPPPAEQPGA